MRTPVHASGFSGHGYRAAGAIDDLPERAASEHPAGYNERARPGFGNFSRPAVYQTGGW
jgi:hypothetical protein